MDQKWLIIGAFLVCVLVVAVYFWRRKRKGRIRLEQDVTGLYRYYKDTQFERKAVLALPETKKAGESQAKQKGEKKVVAVVRFDGDIRAKHHNAFAKLIDEIEINKDKIREVVIVVNSGGGMVSTYGHAYAEVKRLRELGVLITVCIDVVAASGGYLMSLPAQKIVAAPFAVVGSVGVMAFVPNVRKLLERFDVNPRTFTAGKLKRTVTLTDNASPEEVARFQGQLEAIHRLFIDAVKTYRPRAQMDEVETGDHWTAQESVEKELGLVDEIATSNKYLLEKNKLSDLVFISTKKSFFDDGIGALISVGEGLYLRLFGGL